MKSKPPSVSPAAAPKSERGAPQWNRRRFLRASSSAAAAVGTGLGLGFGFGFPSLSLPRARASARAEDSQGKGDGKEKKDEKLRIVVVGAGGQGARDTDFLATEQIVALCDIDDTQLLSQRKKYRDAKVYKDFRLMLEVEKSYDAVVVATPDHLHAPAVSMALKMGKHVFCQKPLAHSVYEARFLRELAAEKKDKVATQMGNTGSAADGLRRAIEVVQAGIIGPVRQVHIWNNRPIWPQGQERSPGSEPVPETLNWDLFLGPAPERPYLRDVYHPYRWRGWVDFGTGALGDMATLTANLPFRALQLGLPTEVEAEATAMSTESYPKSSKIRFEFPARGDMPAVTLWWYDGGWRPHPDLTGDVVKLMGALLGSGCLLIGDKGKLYSPDDHGAQSYLKVGDEKDFKALKNHDAVRDVPESLPRSKGHYREWVDACKGGPAAFSNFDIAGVLTEAFLVGNLALRTGTRLEWDGQAMKAKNAPEADRFVRREYRQGWVL